MIPVRSRRSNIKVCHTLVVEILTSSSWLTQLGKVNISRCQAARKSTRHLNEHQFYFKQEPAKAVLRSPVAMLKPCS